MSSYYDLLNEFYDLLQCNQVSSSAQLLYYTLLQINNKCGWTEWFQRTNISICSMTGMSEKTLIRSRNELKQLGLIEFESTRKSKSITKYKVSCKMYGINSSTNSSTNSRHNKTKDKDIDKDKDREKEYKEKECSVTAVEDTTVSSNNLLHLVPYAEIVELYNSICLSLSPVVKLTDKRKQVIGARYREYKYDIETFRSLFEKVQESPFLRGDNSKGWQADFDWLMRPNNFVKVMEDKYKPKVKEAKQVEQTTEGGVQSGKYGIYL